MSDAWAALASHVPPPAARSPIPYHDGWAPNPPAHTLAPFTFDYPDDLLGVDLATAITVPAFARGLSIIAGTVSSFPLELWRDGARLPRPQYLEQPDPAATRAYTLACTVEDLVAHGAACWARLPGQRFAHAYHLDNAWRYTDQTGQTRTATDLVTFRIDRWGVLRRAVHALRTAADLERAALRYARSPAPRTMLKGRGDVQLPDDRARALVDAYEAAARRSATAYVDAVDVEQVGWSSAELQLVEARQASAAQVALCMNLDPIWVGASQPGSSLTYQNRQDLYRSLIDVTLRPYLDTIEQRLSMNDVTEQPGPQPDLMRTSGAMVRFDLDYFLRGNPAERTTIVTQLLERGLVDLDWARALLDLYPPEESTPA